MFPAYAGMDRCRPPIVANVRSRVPRLRGDGPAGVRLGVKQGDGMCSPPTRGWTVSFRVSAWSLLVFPAYAGRTACTPSRCPAPAGVPSPTRGWTGLAEGRDDPLDGVQRLRGDGPESQRCSLNLSSVFPAYAGMDRHPHSSSAACMEDVPRLRGDGPFHSPWCFLCDACSPPTRGWTELQMLTWSGTIVFPAYAGMDRALAGVESCLRRVPRLRGDGPW